MSFNSILFENKTSEELWENSQPKCFADLNLDHIISSIISGKQEYNLAPIFYTLLKSKEAILFRQAVFKDLENPKLLEDVKAFAQQMILVRNCLTQSDRLTFHYQKENWLLDAIEIYCNGVTQFVNNLKAANLQSKGFLSFREYIQKYVSSEAFKKLCKETQELKQSLLSIKYRLLILDNGFQVLKEEPASDYSAEVLKTFEKFSDGTVIDYQTKYSERVDLNHIEEKILTFVAELNPTEFSNLDQFCQKNKEFIDETIRKFDREIQFYISYLEYIESFKRVNLKVNYPEITLQKEIYNHEGYDFALAHQLIGEGRIPVTNDFDLKDPERILVVSGPNQGGKTTFARTFGQLHYLACLGCLVAGTNARLFLFDKLRTHFEKEENIENLRSKLEDDLVRIHGILKEATSNSIIIMNEIFTSTTLQDAIFLGKKIMQEIIDLDLLCVCVTFIDELASQGEKTVSMASTVVPNNPAERTFKVIRKPADGLSYALSIAEKYHLTQRELKERIKP